MKKPHIPAIRELLREHKDGLTAKQIHHFLPYIYKVATVKSSLTKMPDAYVDRWTITLGSRGQYEAVWCVVVPPANCPHPQDRFYAEPKTAWQERS